MPSQSTTILVAGGTGFIGSHLARKLVALDQSFLLPDMYPNHQTVSDTKDRVEIVEGDVDDWISQVKLSTNDPERLELYSAIEEQVSYDQP